MSVQRNIKKATIPVYRLDIPVSENNTFPVQFRIRTQDGSKVSAWSNVYEIDGPTIEGGDALTLKNKASVINAKWEDDNNRVLYDVYAYKFSNIDLTTFGTSRKTRPTSTTAQIVTYATDTVDDNNKIPHNLKVGMRIAVSNFGTNYDIADTYVTSVPDPHTFIYSPVPTVTVDTSPTTDSDGLVQIFGTTSAGYTIAISDYEYIGRTNKNEFGIPKSIKKTTLGNQVYTSTATDLWCMVQAASTDKKPNDLLDIATGYIAL
jgi:hypothetical protein